MSIAWGNGQSSPGQIEGSGGAFAISSDYVYPQTGTYGVTVAIREDGQTVATVASTASVGDIVEGQTATLAVISFNDSTPSPPSSYTATIAWGDGTSSAGIVQGVQGQYMVQGNHAYASPGTYDLTITVSKGSTTLSGTGSVVVVDAPLSLFADNVSTVEGQPLTNVPVAIFVDADPDANPAEFGRRCCGTTVRPPAGARSWATDLSTRCSPAICTPPPVPMQWRCPSARPRDHVG